MAKSRNYCFTLNNYTDAEISQISTLECRYVCYGKEVGESGTPHLQGFISFENPRILPKKCIPRAHFEAVKGTQSQAIAYCEKDGVFIERGIRPMDQKRKGEANADRFQLAWENAKLGDFEAIPADIRINSYRTLRAIQKDYMVKAPNLEAETGTWICGPSRCGKTLKAAKDYPEAYQKMANKWWDGYQGEDTVILEDLGKEHSCLGHHLKLWSDWRSFTAEVKGGAMNIRPNKFVVTSQYRICEIWEDQETIDALMNRFHVVDMFPPVSPYAAIFNK